MDSVTLMAIRAALPAWRTTLKMALHRESGIPPAAILLQERQLRAAARIQRLDVWHPLVLKSRESLKETISRFGLRLPAAEGPGRIHYPKGELNNKPLELDRQLEAEHAKQWIANFPSDTVCAYSDGSSCGPAKSAWGYSLYRRGQLIASGAGPIHGTEVYDAEILGALEVVLSKAGTSPIKLLLDNAVAVQALQRDRTKSSQAVVDKFVAQLQRCHSVEIRWIPGHSGVIENEEADKLAKGALRNHPAGPIQEPAEDREEHKFTFSAVARFVKEQVEGAVESWWLEHRPSRYESLDLLMKRKRPPELALPRWAYHRLIAARTGHGDIKAYHKRFGHENMDCKCICGRERRPWHSTECRTALQEWRKIKQEPPPRARLMSAEKGGEEFFEFLTVTRCYERHDSDRESHSFSR
ncbi:hypothetical protein K3495_g2547 [Podosphaera aphanis]|nr:hypothetical protein K3495_g2547 [Podosphaera aphanis]